MVLTAGIEVQLKASLWPLTSSDAHRNTTPVRILPLNIAGSAEGTLAEVGEGENTTRPTNQSVVALSSARPETTRHEFW
jgi:hypothetical protein